MAKLLQFIRIFSHFHSCPWVWNPKQCITVGCALSLCALSLSLSQVGGVDPKQLAVYEEFARNVPGFLPSNDLSQPTGFLAQPMKVAAPIPPSLQAEIITPFVKTLMG